VPAQFRRRYAPKQLNYPSAGEISARLGGHRVGDGRYMAKCPCHDDRTPSLSIIEGKDRYGNRRPYVTCFAGCNFQDVQAALERLGLWPRFERERS
jgi:hypothetical protein